MMMMIKERNGTVLEKRKDEDIVEERWRSRRRRYKNHRMM